MLRTWMALAVMTMTWIAPAQAADELATAFPPPSKPLPRQDASPAGGSLSGLLGGSLQVLAPALASRGVQLQPNFPVATQVRAGSAQEVLTTLLLNGLTLVPAGGLLEINYQEGRVQVWVPNPQVLYDTDRTAADLEGRLYRVETLSGQGTLLSAAL